MGKSKSTKQEQAQQNYAESQREQNTRVRHYNAIQNLKNQLGIGGTPTQEQISDAIHKSDHNDPEYIKFDQERSKYMEEQARAEEISKTHMDMDKKLDEQR
jgi:hypothetical protein